MNIDVNRVTHQAAWTRGIVAGGGGGLAADDLVAPLGELALGVRRVGEPVGDRAEFDRARVDCSQSRTLELSVDRELRLPEVGPDVDRDQEHCREREPDRRQVVPERNHAPGA